jgi:hypothetical protein
MPDASKTLAEPVRNRRRPREVSSDAFGLVRSDVLAEQRDGEQVFAIAGIRRGGRGHEKKVRSNSAAGTV